MNSPMENPRLLIKVIGVQVTTKKPTEAQVGAIVAWLGNAGAKIASLGTMLESIANHPDRDDSSKLEVLMPIFTALKTGNYEPLIADEKPAERFNPLESNAGPVIDITPVQTPAAPVERHRENTVADQSDDVPVVGQLSEDPADLLRRAIVAMSNKTPAKPIDEAKVEAIVAAALAGHLDTITSNMSELIASLEKRLTEATGKATRLEIVHPDKVIDLGADPVHCQFPQILTWLSGNVPVWLWGKAGGGKTHLGRQLAKALDLPATIVSIDPTMTVGKLLGYRNLATGEYVEGFLIKPYRDGGLLMLDEIDTGDPGILACLNALLANGHYMFPNGETIERHPKFRVIAGANTRGTGATAGYTARQKLDAATLNRFAIIELQYDEKLEELLALGSDTTAPTYPDCKRWVTWVRKVRATVGSSVLISPRASYLGVAAIRAGVKVSEVAEALVFGLVTDDTKRNINSSCGTP